MFTKRWKKNLLALAGLLVLGPGATLPAQVLARPGWAGSGIAPESWWPHAVFYRVDPARFQASAGAGTGDLAGIPQRLGYLQSLGVDALILDAARSSDGFIDSGNPDGLDDLTREASRYRLRVLLTVSPSAQKGEHQQLLQTVHGWLIAGAAGVFLPRDPGQGALADAAYRSLVFELHNLLRSFPGERVLLADPVSQSTQTDLTTAHPTSRSAARSSGGSGGAQLNTLALLPVQSPAAAALRQSLEAVAAANGASTPGLLRFAGDPPTGSPEAAAAAALLLGSRGTALMDFGDEIGLDAFAPMSSGGGLPVMQWTPRNVQEAAAAPVERKPPAGSGQGETAFGAYHPYIHPPPPTLTGTAPASPRVTVDGDIPAALPDPNGLPGFTTGTLPNRPVDGEQINVVTEDRDPGSLLNVYRQLIALHHGNATLRNGTQIVLNRDAQDAVVWVRRAPAGSRTAASVVVAVNLGDQPVTLALDSDLATAGVNSGVLRALFTWAKQPMTGETTGALRLPPHAVFLGELPHARAGISSARRR